VWVPNSNAHYRAIDPMKAMMRRGHEVVWPASSSGDADFARLASCHVVHVYRRADDQTRRVLAQLARAGVAVTFDNDDDLTAIPKESPDYKKYGGLVAQRLWAMSVKAARMADCFTTTNEALAAKYRRAGVKHVEVIGNYLAPDVSRARQPHDGIVVGWIAGIDHAVDVARIGITDALARLIAEHDSVRVESIGVKLRLAERYRHDAMVEFVKLPGRIGGFDVRIAPLADLRCNHARSEIKLKEYAASGVPWLASPVGPYRGLGETQGGRLVADDAWFKALDHLVTDARQRKQLGRNAHAWATTQTIDAVADTWEQVFANAAGHDSVDGASRVSGAHTGVAVRSGKTVRIRSRGASRLPRNPA
jgi:glycosyltransferase involved in cell wall biosynthesis